MFVTYQTYVRDGAGRGVFQVVPHEGIDAVYLPDMAPSWASAWIVPGTIDPTT